MAELIGYGSLKQKLDILTKEAKAGSGEVVVGHAMPYSTTVHETHKHQAKFLENAFRSVVNSGQARKMIREGYRTHKNLTKALASVAKLIKETSQENTPVKTGALQASAFYSVGDEADTEYRARVRGEKLIQEYKKQFRKRK